MLELLFELLFELVVEVFGDVLVHLFAAKATERPVAWAFIGYAILGVFAGFATLLFFPEHFIHDAQLRIVNVLVTPVLIGLFMAWIGRVRAKRDQAVVRFERFTFAYVFALAMAAVRWIWA